MILVFVEPSPLTFFSNSLDYIFRLAVEMRNLGLPWVS